jgi:murein DD-endopeptidase MepM/ murein hydrolase activator NlpD
MAHRFSFIILGGFGSRMKQFHFDLTRRQLICSALIMAIGAAVVGFALVDYVRLHGIAAKSQRIERALVEQTDQVTHQRKQIQAFAKEINTLKDRLVQLDQFERQVRTIASIDQSNTSENGLFGIGGSTPEDIDANIELDKKHTRMIRQMHRQVNQLETASESKKKSFSALLGALERQKNVLSHTPTIRPAEGWLSSRFGYRVSPFSEKREFHRGIDIANRAGTPIIATADGVVTFCGPKSSWGNVVVIDNGYGVTTRFAHLQKALVARGEHVKRGDVIANMGNTGRSTGPHLHYEVYLNGVPVNPEKYLMD